ncbi:hypothetical protein J2Q15_09305 [Tenacibaculum finnmarkense genomovar finnmarkense]|uniref:hypothetical protein n=1 Tax=Tenacibaculum finnmarkense TaxID=2781243 RepID=UPI001EFC13F3|nr:hypothetical protein [Tenacibaculum finnmarkense]MCG8249718.1 hypothetical protein [Tenacibaculum finnmarkense genomovar finnmarkense]
MIGKHSHCYWNNSSKSKHSLVNTHFYSSSKSKYSLANTRIATGTAPKIKTFIGKYSLLQLQ